MPKNWNLKWIPLLSVLQDKVSFKDPSWKSRGRKTSTFVTRPWPTSSIRSEIVETTSLSAYNLPRSSMEPTYVLSGPINW